MLDAGYNFRSLQHKCKNLILKSKYHNQSAKKKESKTLANYSNIKPALSSYRRIFKTNEFQ
jgi:hypothetical protein